MDDLTDKIIVLKQLRHNTLNLSSYNEKIIDKIIKEFGHERNRLYYKLRKLEIESKHRKEGGII